ncbi:hypothetical protein LCGC14_0588550 [marine sediment metagenome]|uniref:Uncharacterized protein n=1 Tax=marine sediment metagenome TaxID=412755 RepID=A0A0F9U0F0_9ZZZZ
MDAFEEWLKPRNVLYDIRAEAGWRAALKFLYDKLSYSEEHEELKDLIEKELDSR